ncbi:YEATS-associated helix-containing protein [Spirosoma endophyticum]|uniref:YEATS-Like-Associating Three TM domain-containing protein n=1 Tax=Spirosoma endophyticum TaxID=662367 RepID=A0A1I2GEU3_9BACT|nr:YEATS-associated helix-containing protein [Spirosoma endophyticum]SFF15437.1 hypothetical protein SAMN05216167_13140 [Spirosoma endophyticum]
MFTFLFCLLLWIPGPTQPIPGTATNGTSATATKTASTSPASSTTQATASKAAAQTTLSPAAGAVEKQTTTEPLDVWTMLLIIVACGLLGGTWNYLRTYDTVKVDAINTGADSVERLNRHVQICLLGGVVAGGIVPFVLMSASSDLLDKPSTYHYFVFGAYCLAAAVSSAAFIEAAAGSLLDRLNKTEKALVAKTTQNEHLQSQVSTLKTLTNKAIQVAASSETAGTPEHTQQLKALNQQLESIN